ncbi:MAG TPA: hypothetical protein VFN11_00260 [Ktedonobacterales bacterium]|nr:hypothetical protein [Ktedonobacterales bacterium]
MIRDWLERLCAYWKASRRNQIIVAASCAVLFAIVLGGVALANRGGASNTSSTSNSSNGIPASTAPIHVPGGPDASTPQAVATSTPLPTKPVNKATIGGTEAGFTAVYGKPTGTGTDSGNNLPTVTYKGTGPIGSITIELDSTRRYVVGVVVSAQQSTPWDATTVNAIYPHYAPANASYDQARSITNGSNQDVGLFLTGHSRLLASTLPASVFTDNQGQAVASGTFSIEIYYINGSNGTLAYAVSLRLGDQPVSPAG